MILRIALAVGTAAAPQQWEALGFTNSGWRIFIDRGSVTRAGAMVDVTVRIGSPRTIVRNVVEMFQD